MLKKFVGFKGVAAAAAVRVVDGGPEIAMFLVARSGQDLAALWAELLPKAGPLDLGRILPTILIEPETLPDPKGAARGRRRPPARECVLQGPKPVEMPVEPLGWNQAPNALGQVIESRHDCATDGGPL